MSVLATNLGFPRIGAQRELKKAVEAYWAGTSTQAELLATAKELRASHWSTQQKAGLNHIPSNDFSFYDQVLDTLAVVGAIPERYRGLLPEGSDGRQIQHEELLTSLFAMARGLQNDQTDVKAMEMSKWFDTNYHYIVPEFNQDTTFQLFSTKIFDEYVEAKALGVETRPVIIGPVTLAILGKSKGNTISQAAVVEKLLPVYVQILKKLTDLGCKWVQIDEPALAAFDLEQDQLELFTTAYNYLHKEAYNGTSLKVLVATYFESLRNHIDLAVSLPVDALHVDLCRVSGKANAVVNDAKRDVTTLAEKLAAKATILSVGVVDGRNIWKNNLRESIALVNIAVEKLGKSRVFIAPSASLLHVPVDLTLEAKINTEIKDWLAFGVQKLSELTILAKAVNEGLGAVEAELTQSDSVVQSRATSTLIHNQQVKERCANITPEQLKRNSPFSHREQVQKNHLKLPLFPTTTIGSFPQTAEIRSTRAQFKAGKMSEEEYTTKINAEIKTVVDFQIDANIDVLVHGEAERGDMVEFFGEQLQGFVFSQFGWVQSYGSRCVKPAIIYGDVSRPTPMTVKWSKYAQTLTNKPMKGMLTGPVTILAWTFVRDDQPRSETTKQIALAIHDEVADLEAAGIGVIQIDEAALREGLPLRSSDHAEYLRWAVESFKLTSCCVQDQTQIHTHMCYSEFNQIIESIAAMDTDCISIEASRSDAELLDAFVRFHYPQHIGPGVYDIHSPRVPTQAEIEALLRQTLAVIKPSAVWVNPDCGLKTRAWSSVTPALENMVAVAKKLREEYAQ